MPRFTVAASPVQVGHQLGNPPLKFAASKIVVINKIATKIKATTTGGKDPAKAKQIELKGWDYPRHLAGRAFSVVVHGDAGEPGLEAPADAPTRGGRPIPRHTGR